MTELARFKHDCASCVFLGRFQEVDLYFCPLQQPMPTVIARRSDEPADYASGLALAEMDSALAEAKRRAIERGHLRVA